MTILSDTFDNLLDRNVERVLSCFPNNFRVATVLDQSGKLPCNVVGESHIGR